MRLVCLLNHRLGIHCCTEVKYNICYEKCFLSHRLKKVVADSFLAIVCHSTALLRLEPYSMNTKVDRYLSSCHAGMGK